MVKSSLGWDRSGVATASSVRDRCEGSAFTGVSWLAVADSLLYGVKMGITAIRGFRDFPHMALLYILGKMANMGIWRFSKNLEILRRHPSCICRFLGLSVAVFY